MERLIISIDNENGGTFLDVDLYSDTHFINGFCSSALNEYDLNNLVQFLSNIPVKRVIIKDKRRMTEEEADIIDMIDADTKKAHSKLAKRELKKIKDWYQSLLEEDKTDE